MKVVSFVISTFCIVYCLGRESGRIIGGDEVLIEEAPYQVSILYFGQLLCGGSIISCKFILTAAHCMYRRRVELIPEAYLLVRAGSANYSDGGSEHEVRCYNIHPLWDSYLYDYDASILTLKTHIQFDSLRKPIKLPYLNEPFVTGTSVTTSGWGITENGTISNVLMMIQIKIVDQVECFKAHEGNGGTTTTMICAADTSKDACNGDSGGPLVDVSSKKLVGIVSFGDPSDCAVEGVPGVYTRVASIRQWIRKIIKF